MYIIVLLLCRECIQEYLHNNAIWTQQIKPFLPKIHLSLRFSSVLKIGGLYSLLTVHDGYSVASRTTFIAHCLNKDKTLGQYIQFVDFCFRLRHTNDAEIYRHLIQHIIQKQLAKKLVQTSEIARLYRTVTSKQHIEAVVQFLKYGVPLNIEIFDQLLMHCLNCLIPVYRSFLLFHPDGAIIRDHQIAVIAEAYDVSATIIQCAIRKKIATERCKVLSVARAKIREENKQKILAHQKKRPTRKQSV